MNEPDARVVGGAGSREALSLGLRIHWEAPGEALAIARAAADVGRSTGDSGLFARALVLEAAVALRRGELERAFGLLLEAEDIAEGVDAPNLVAELALARSRFDFLSGSFGEALSLADRAVEISDRLGLDQLGLMARRARNLILGSIGSPLLTESVSELIRRSSSSGDRKEEAMARNDFAYDLFMRRRFAEAAEAIEVAIALARGLGDEGRIALAYAVATRAEIRVERGDVLGALVDFDESLALAAAGDESEPYLLAVTMQARAQALTRLGRLDDAIAEARAGLERLGDRVPHARALLLQRMAAALREAGRHDEAYTALERSVELERTARLELTASQLELQRAGLEAKASRREALALATKNRELEVAHAQLEQRMDELERLRDRLREQADSDWLTGLRNRRFLAREFRALARSVDLDCPLTIAVLDLDHFKSINDRYGHEIGDRVLKQTATHLKRSVRAGDAVVRSGGEEFLIVMPGVPAATAVERCERLRRRLEAHGWEKLAHGLRVTASVGVASTEEPLEPTALLSTADARLYTAKASGRNCVVGAAGSRRRADAAA